MLTGTDWRELHVNYRLHSLHVRENKATRRREANQEITNANTLNQQNDAERDTSKTRNRKSVRHRQSDKSRIRKESGRKHRQAVKPHENV